MTNRDKHIKIKQPIILPFPFPKASSTTSLALPVCDRDIITLGLVEGSPSDFLIAPRLSEIPLPTQPHTEIYSKF